MKKSKIEPANMGSHRTRYFARWCSGPLWSLNPISTWKFEFFEIKDGGQLLFYKLKNRHFCTMVKSTARKFDRMMLRHTLSPLKNENLNVFKPKMADDSYFKI